MLYVHVVGVGDAFTERYHNACLCVEDSQSGFRLMIDCPPAFPKALADYRQGGNGDLRVDNISHLLLTHLHGDHCGGTEAYLYMRRFLLGKKPVLLGAKEVLDPLWDSRLRGGMEELLLEGSADGPRVKLGLLDYTDRQDLGDGKSRVGPFLIERRFTIHHIPTTALRIRRDDSPRPILSYSADTAFSPELIDWLAEAELVIHETNFGVHTPLGSLLTLAPELQQRLRLIHYPDLLEPDTAPLPCLRQGQRLSV